MEKNRIIDIHAHFTTDSYLKMIEKHGASMEDGFPLPSWSAEEHLEFMDQCGIEWSLISLSSPQPYFSGAEKESIEICRQLNTEASGIKKQYPDRFGFQACLPLPDVDTAIEEAVYALDILDADGIKFASNSRGLYLGDSALEPLMDKLDKRHAVCNIHPHRPEPIKEEVFSAGPVPLFEFIADTTRAVLNLVGNGVIERYSNITWIIPHCGSFLPNIYQRFIGISHILVPKGMMQDIDIKGSFEKLYYDIAGNPAELLDLFLTMTTPDHIMYGSDFPFTPAPAAEANLKQVIKMLDQREELRSWKEAVLYGNAASLFKL